MTIALLVLSVGLILGWLVGRKTGYLAPASIYIWFMNIDLAFFILIATERINESYREFTAMPWPPFDATVRTTVVIYGILILAGWISVVKLRKRKMPFRATQTFWRAFSPMMNSNFILAFLFVVLCMEIFHFMDINKSILWRNQEYLTIAKPYSAGIDTLPGRLIHFLLRPLGLLLIGASAFFWVYRRKQIAILLFLFSIYPFLLAFAGNSRWAPLYAFAASMVFIFLGGIKRYFLLVLFDWILGFLLFLKVLIGRDTPYQGLAGTFDIFALVFSKLDEFERWTIGFFLNIFQGAQSLANAFLIHPQYPENYKLLSFSPTISAIDHFDKVMNVYMVKIAPVVPMNAYGEAYFFGLPYFLLLLLILIAWLRMMTKLFLRRDEIGTAFTVFSYWLIFYISQYPVRNSMRLIYLSLLLGILANKKFSVKSKIRARKSVA